MSAPIANPFQRAARLRKVQALVLCVDDVATKRGIDPIDQAEQVLTTVLGHLNERGWTELGELAAVREPSHETRELLIETYRDRARLAGLSDVYAVHYYDPSRRGTWVRKFRGVDADVRAGLFASGVTLHGKPAKAERVQP